MSHPTDFFHFPDELPDGQSCGHPGCLQHTSHPCEGCGRVAGFYVDEDITAELRSMGPILEPVSADQRRQLDMIGALRPAIKKQRRRAKKSARRGE